MAAPSGMPPVGMPPPPFVQRPGGPMGPPMGGNFAGRGPPPFGGALPMGAPWGPVAPELAAVGMTAVNLKKVKYLQPRPQDPHIPPNCTIYVSNINDRIKLKELKENLKSMFKQFGEIRQIVAMSSFWRRGQAWIVFREESAATAAINGMQGFVYHGQPLHINYALSKSDIVAKEEGSFTARPPGPRKPRRVREKEAQQKAIFLQLQHQYLALKGPGSSSQHGTDGSALAGGSRQAQSDVAGGTSTTESGGSNKVLFVENLPDGCTNFAVQQLFSQAEGLVDIRAILFKKVAFVEYSSEAFATKALNKFQNATISGIPLRVSYARK